jgi:ABC-type multidrug transport system fused ATPase/permease subunit
MAQLPNIISKDRNIWQIFWWVIKIAYKSSPRSFTGAVVFVAMIASIGFLNSYNFAEILNILTKENPTISAIMLPLGLVLLFDFLPRPFHYIRASLREHNDRMVTTYLEQKIIEKQAELDIATIEQPEFQDLLYQARNRGENSLINILIWFFILLDDVLRIGIAFAIIFSFTKIGLLLIIVFTIPTYFYESWRGKNLGKIWTERSELNRKAGTKVTIFNEKSSVLEVKFFGLVDMFKNKILDIRKERNDVLAKDDIKTAPIYALSTIAPITGIGITIYTVIQGVIKGVFNIGSLSFIWGAIWNFSSALNSVLRSVGRLSEYKIHANKVIDLLEMKPYVSENLIRGGSTNMDTGYTLEFRNVSFTYPGSERKILDNISCNFKQGEEVAIVGLNGAGKTTLLRLITRVYDPTDGIILLNGKDLREYNLAEYRKIMGVMMQDYHTYSDETIRDNIVTNKDFDQKLFDEVTTQTGVLEYVKQYETGFDQMIGTEFRGGVELSKGQKQKLALARVLYRNAPIIILDEPTAAIDALSEDTIFKSLRENHTDQTRIIISHKFSNVRDADNIILIEHGTIIEQGSHEQLMSIDNGRYKELFELQAEGYK